ncbi:hypothetical protein EIN_359320 [Entamoeba invadens IP1]|uniref:DOCKER domain-containing protein n=1 Tax=Entamoeba invadens IP1 TaxID=370355 RepID=A0A0A1UDM6_ENTIV|nr:hypothetical protein EIN_359320 [Entamoeba invadens IP1]ELP90849.1 hypothetical protein EIN_359320 [Entamoeba invadens IP1]|eukprot:XP_004257620.1 hypothetical protein EIN_359320 [Entamoeba invadens IP1]
MEHQLDTSVLSQIFETDFRKTKVVMATPERGSNPIQKTETSLKILSKFDLYDTENNKELDVYQLRKYIEGEWKICLSEESIKYHCGQNFLEKAYKVQRNEFIAFHKYITANLEEIKKENTQSDLEVFESQFTEDSPVDSQYKLLDKNCFVIEKLDKFHSIMYPDLIPPEKGDPIHCDMYNVIFGKTISIYKKHIPFRSVFTTIPDNFVPKNDNLKKLFSIDSLFQSITNKVGQRRKKAKNFFEFFDKKISHTDFLYSTNLSNARDEDIEVLKKYKKPSVIEMVNIKLPLNIEKLHCRLSFYDTNYIKLSADYCFNVDPSDLQASTLNVPLSSFVMRQEIINKSVAFIVVFQVFKAMDADISFAREVYANDNKRDAKNVKKYSDRVKESAKFFEQKKYQLLMFSSKQILFTGNYELFKLYKPPNEVKDIVWMIKECDKWKLCGEWTFKFKASKKELVHVDGESEFNNQEHEEKPIFIKSLTNLSLQDSEDIFTDYRNFLFCYPTELCLGKERKRGGCLITVYCRDTDAKFAGEITGNLPVIFPNNSSCHVDMQTSLTTTVATEKVGKFTDEIKLELPFPLTPTHHLLFCVRDIGTDDGVEGRPLFAKLPLYENGRVVENKEYTLRIMKEMNDHYLKTNEYYDQSKMYLKVTINVVSTVYPTERVLTDFLYFNAPVDTVLYPDLYTEMIHFLPSVLHRCLRILQDRNREEIFSMFKLFKVFDVNKNVEEEKKESFSVYKNKNVVYAINHFVRVKTDENVYNCMFIVASLPIIFDRSETNATERLKYIWIIFALLIKSLIAFYNDHNAFNLPNFHTFCCGEDAKIISANLVKNIDMCSDFIVYCSALSFVDPLVVREANLFYAEFIRDFAMLWRHDDTTKLVISHLDNICKMSRDVIGRSSSSFSRLLRLEFISVLAEGDHIFQLNGPQNLEVKGINKLNDTIAQRHTLMFIILRQFFVLILDQDKLISKMALHELVLLMNKFDLDKSLSSQHDRERFFGMMFPFVLFFLDDSEKINEWRKKDCTSDLNDIECLYMIFFFILKNLEDNLLDQWLVAEYLPSMLNTLLVHIRKALLLFSVFPMQTLPDAPKLYLKELQTLLNSIETQSAPNIARSPSPGLSKIGSSLKMHVKNNSQNKRLSSKYKKDDDVKEPSTPRVGLDRLKLKKYDDDEEGRRSVSPRGSGSGAAMEYAKMSATPVFSNLSCSAGARTITVSSCETADPNVLNMITDVSLIAMDYLEIMISVLIRDDKTQAMDRIQEIVSDVLFKIKTTPSYLVSLYKFIFIVLTTYREFLFLKPNQMCINLLKNLLSLSNSQEVMERDFANNLLFTFAKTNFIVTGNTVSTIVSAISALSELNLANVQNVKTSVKGLLELSSQYHYTFDLKLQRCVELLLDEGSRKIEALQKVQQIYRAIDGGNLDVFITFVKDCMLVFEDIIEFATTANTTVINGYDVFKSEVGGLLKTNEIFKMVGKWIIFIEHIQLCPKDSFYLFLEEKKKELRNSYTHLEETIVELEKLCVTEKEQMKRFEKQCDENKTVGNRLFTWVKTNLQVQAIDYDTCEDSQLINIIEDLEKEQNKRVNGIKSHIEKYCQFDEVLKEMGLLVNPLFPVTSQEMGECVKKVLQLHQNRIKLVHQLIHVRTSYDTEYLIYTEKLKHFEKTLETMNSDIAVEISSKPITGHFLEDSMYRYKMLDDLFSTCSKKLNAKKVKMGGMKPTWEITYNGWEDVISLVLSTLELTTNLLEKVKQNDYEVIAMKEWYLKETKFNKTIIGVFMWDGMYSALNKVAMKESNDFLEILAGVYEYLSTHLKDVETRYNECVDILQHLRKKKLPLGFKYLQKKINVKDFEMLAMSTELYVDQFNEEKTLEKSRKEYADLFVHFFKFTDKLCDDADKMQGLQNTKAVTGNTSITNLSTYFKQKDHTIDPKVLEEISKQREKLLSFEEQKIDKLNRYCDLTQITQTVLTRCSLLGLPDKEKEPLKISYNAKIPRSVSLPKSNNKLVELKDVLSFFMDSKDCIKLDCFHDLSYGQRDNFNKDLKNVEDDILNVLDSLEDINTQKRESSDPQLVLQRFEGFAMNYVAAPQLHLTWMTRLAQQHRDRGQYVEAGMCEIHMVLFIHRLLENNTRTVDCSEFVATFGNFVENTSTAPSSQFTAHFTEEMMIKHISNAADDFEKGNIAWYGLVTANVLIPYYIEKRTIKELGKTHDYVNRMYSTLVSGNSDHFGRDNLAFYYVQFVGKVFGEKLDGKKYIYVSTRNKMPMLIKEIKDVVPKSFKGERHIISSLDKMNEQLAISGDAENQCHIVFSQITPLYEKGKFVQYASKFNFDCLMCDEGKDPTVITNWFKNRIVLETNLVLPGVLRRQEVTQKEQFYRMSAIEIAIDEIERKTEDLKFYLDESFNFLKETDDESAKLIVKKTSEILCGSNDIGNERLAPKLTVFEKKKLVEFLHIFFYELQDENINSTVLTNLFNASKEALAVVREAIAVVNETYRNVIVNETTRSNIENIERQADRVDYTLDEIENTMKSQLGEDDNL